MGTHTQTTSTSQPQLEFSPEQLSAQRLGLRTIAETLPLQEMQRRRALSLLRSMGDPAMIARGEQQAIARPIGAAGELVRGGLATSLGQMGLQPSSYLPAIQRLEMMDRQGINAARNSVMDQYLAGAPIALYRPDLGRYITEPKSARNVTTTNVDSQEGEGAMLIKTLATAAGILSAFVK